MKRRRIIIPILLLCMLHVLIIIGYGLTNEAKPSDVIVVLGNKVELTGKPSARLQARLDKGIALWKADMAPHILMSGGIGIEGFDESEVMARYAIEKGVPASAIIRDSLGLNIFASAKNTKAILHQHKTTSVILVSQYFHLLRSEIAFRKAGIADVSVEAAGWFWEWRDLYSISREVVGCYYYVGREYE
mgnify:CR=1 FL=1